MYLTNCLTKEKKKIFNKLKFLVKVTYTGKTEKDYGGKLAPLNTK